MTKNVGVSVKVQKKFPVLLKKNHVWNRDRCICQNGTYLGSIIDDSVITFNEIMEETKTVQTKTVSAKNTSTNFHDLLTFLLITISLLITAIINSCFIKYREEQKHLLPHLVTNNN